MAKKIDSFAKARDYAFLLLKFRLRSEKEISGRLKKKGVPDGIIKETLSFLKEKRFIDDSEFSRAWVEGRLKRSFGLRRIGDELRLKGVKQEVIDSELERAKQDYDEENIAQEIAGKKFKSASGGDPQKAKRRIYAYLIRRGFPPDTVNEVVSKL